MRVVISEDPTATRVIESGSNFSTRVEVVEAESVPALRVIYVENDPTAMRVYTVLAPVAPVIADIWISPLGNDTTGDGSRENPLLSLQQAIDWAGANDVIGVMGGTYYPASLISVYKSDITITADAGSSPIFNAINYPTPDDFNSRVIRLQDVDNVTIVGLGFTQGPDGGMQIIGTNSDITIDRCSFFQNGRRSLYEGEGFVCEGDMDNLLVINCDSFENFDAIGDIGLNADGFRVSIYSGSAAFVGCRSWNNSDDGFDAFNNSFDPGVTTVPVVFSGCWAWSNGYFASGTPTLGDGMGFKLGGQRTGLGNGSGGNTAINCLAWDNRENGFTDNESTIANTQTHNTSFRTGNISFEAHATGTVVQNNISYEPGLADDNISDPTYVDHNSWDISGIVVSDTDFLSLVAAPAIAPRSSDGVLPQVNYLMLAPDSDMIDAGIGGTRLGPVPDDWVLSGSILDLDFTENLGYNGVYVTTSRSFLTTTRASNAYADNAAGVWSLFSSNVPRITDKGLLVEESRTRLNTYPRDLTNAGTWIRSAGLAVPSLNQTGIDGVANSASLLTATVADATAGLYQAFSVTEGTVYTFSFFAKAGTATGLKFAVYDQTNAAFIATDQAYTAGAGSFSRITYTFTAPAGCSTARIYPLRNPGSTGTVIIDAVQAEQGAYRTSPVLATPASTAARASDVITTARAGTASGTIIIQGRTAPGVGSSNQALWQWDDGTSNNRLVLYRDNTGDLIYEVTAGGVTQAYFDLGAVASDTAFKVAASWATDAFDVALNGTAASSDTSGTVPTGLTTIRHGSDTSGSQWGGLILRESILPVASTAAQLEALSA